MKDARLAFFEFQYPCFQTTRILLLCGADMNAFDAKHNTPLHMIVSNNYLYYQSIINLLCDADAHLDYTHVLGQKPVDLATIPKTIELLKSRKNLNLKCLCARLIRRKNIVFQGKFTTSLVSFVEKH